MQPNYNFSIYLDTRRILKDGTYPVKLRLYLIDTRKRKYYPTNFKFTEKEFNSIWETTKPRKEYRETRKKLQAILTKAEAQADKLNPFEIKQFEKKLYRKNSDGNNVVFHYEQVIKKLNKENRFGTASNYKLSLKSLLEFQKQLTNKEPQQLQFNEVTSDWLTKYEKYSLDEAKRSRTTVGIYLRPLRAIFNSAIRDKEITQEIYPFGKGKYQIPSTKTTKKALTKEQLKTLYNSKPQTQEQEKAKDFWFFSYACNGMNMKDVALLKYENIKGNKIIFYRAKTINTRKTDLRPVTVILTDLSRLVIEKYGKENPNKKDFIFPIVDDSLPEVEKHRKIVNFTRFINQGIKKLAVDNNLPTEISTYWARHSFATTAINSGASMEFVSEALNHSNLKTTQGYFAGFEDKTKEELINAIVNFEND